MGHSVQKGQFRLLHGWLAPLVDQSHCCVSSPLHLSLGGRQKIHQHRCKSPWMRTRSVLPSILQVSALLLCWPELRLQRVCLREALPRAFSRLLVPKRSISSSCVVTGTPL